jgi:hypothetical protein
MQKVKHITQRNRGKSLGLGKTQLTTLQRMLR